MTDATATATTTVATKAPAAAAATEVSFEETLSEVTSQVKTFKDLLSSLTKNVSVLKRSNAKLLRERNALQKKLDKVGSKRKGNSARKGLIPAAQKKLCAPSKDYCKFIGISAGSILTRNHAGFLWRKTLGEKKLAGVKRSEVKSSTDRFQSSYQKNKDNAKWLEGVDGRFLSRDGKDGKALYALTKGSDKTVPDEHLDMFAIQRYITHHLPAAPEGSTATIEDPKLTAEVDRLAKEAAEVEAVVAPAAEAAPAPAKETKSKKSKKSKK